MSAQPGFDPGGGPPRLAILGATGGIGGHLLNWAVDAGYPVHVLARRSGAVPRRPGITVTEGDATDPAAVADVVALADAVLSALGPRAGTGQYRVADRHPPPGLTKIARADVAQFMIGVLTRDTYLHQAPAICW